MKIFPILATVFSMAFLPVINADDELGPVFSHDYKEALEMAKSTNKPLILIFSASWCPPCQHMKKSVYPSKEVQPFHDSFVWAYLDADVQENGPILAAYGASAIPHIEFLTSEGKSLGHIANSTSPDQFAKLLQKVLKRAEKKPGLLQRGERRASGKKA